MCQFSEKTENILKDEKGAVVVEFAITLLFLFFFFVAYMQIAQIFIAHERLSFAAFSASRVYSVTKDAGKAKSIARSVDSGAKVQISGQSVSLDKDIDVSIDFTDIFRKGNATFTINKESPVFLEPDLTGDNK